MEKNNVGGKCLKENEYLKKKYQIMQTRQLHIYRYFDPNFKTNMKILHPKEDIKSH